MKKPSVAKRLLVVLVSALIGELLHWGVAAAQENPTPPTPQAAGPRGQVERGMNLFLHNWKVDDQQALGDGLGPLHNDTSCLNCHFLRSPGGAGRLEHNIQLMSALPDMDRDDPESVQGARNLLATLHPSFALGGAPNQVVRNSIVLHRQDTNPGYNTFREILLGRPAGNVPVLEQGAIESHLRVLVNETGVAWIISERNTPALFGIGLIERLPESVFTETAARQRRDSIKGVVPRTADGRVGRFGWRGQSASIQEFVATAFAVEMGISNPLVQQEPSPLAVGARDQAANGGNLQPLPPPRNDINLQEVNDVGAFLASLPAPKMETRSRSELEQSVRGRGVFSTIGCDVCHQRHLGPIRDIFSDLLVHDMGLSLADPVPGPTGVPPADEQGARDALGATPPGANSNIRGVAATTSVPGAANSRSRNTGRGATNLTPTVTVQANLPLGSAPNAPIVQATVGVPTNQSSSSVASPTTPRSTGSLYAPTVGTSVDPASFRLWRTPPLWGVADSAPYLHDGRAGTLRRAIILHDGEGARSRNRFLGLDEESQADLVAFLGSLRAPQLIRPQAPGNDAEESQ